jgi:hypothetical protein
METKAIVLMLVMVLSAFAGCLEDDENTPDGPGDAWIGLSAAYVENTSDDGDVTSALITARFQSTMTDGGPLVNSTTMNSIFYYWTCNVEGETVSTDKLYFANDAEVEQNEYFEFIAELSECAAAQDEMVRFMTGVDVEFGKEKSRLIQISSTEKGASLT